MRNAMRRRTEPEREVINYVSPIVTEELCSKVKEWMDETKTTIMHNYDYATPMPDSSKLFDRGFEILRNGEFSSEAYVELKGILDISSEDRIGYEFFEDIEDKGLAEKNILDYEDDDMEE